MDTFVIFAFQGNPVCFVHVLLNALDMHDKGKDVKIVLEGEAVTLVRKMTESKNPSSGRLLTSSSSTVSAGHVQQPLGFLNTMKALACPLEGT